MKIVVYTKANCPNCVSAKQLLQSKGLEYIEVDIEKIPATMELLQRHHPEVRQMPQIFLNDVRIGGLAGLQAYLPDILAGRVA
jgi:glutaredoxin 3